VAVPNGTGATGTGSGTGTGTGADTTTQTRSEDEDGVILRLRTRADWTPDQIAQAERKVAFINQAAQTPPGVFVTRANRPKMSPRTMLRDASGMSQQEFDELYGDYDIDHQLDLQLGGAHAVANFMFLDRSVNRSFGAQIYHQTRGREGTRVIRVDLIGASGGP